MDVLNLFEQDLTTELTEQETTLLNECELVIKKGIESFKDTWSALLDIRDNKLYRREFKTFEDYCRIKWNISKTYGNKLIQAGKISNTLTTKVVNLGVNQLLPLEKIEPELRNEVLDNLGTIVPKAVLTERQLRPLTSLSLIHL